MLKYYSLLARPVQLATHRLARPLAALGLLLATAGPALAQSFAPVAFYATGPSGPAAAQQPRGLVVADVNGDGKPDALTVNSNSNTLGVLLGNGNGGFTLQGSQPSTGTGSLPLNLAVADVNGDGKLDVLTANQSTSNMGVLLGDGRGGFTLSSSPNTSNNGGSTGSPTGVAVADVNGDGKPDALVANASASTMSVLLGDGSGGFTLSSSPSTGANSQPLGIVAADVNGDGKPDALVANNNTSRVGVLLGNGNGTFKAVAAYNPGSGNQLQALTVADVNGDGKLDVLTANTNANRVGVLLGDGSGAFSTAATTFDTGGVHPESIAVADVNGDGKLDVFTANNTGNTSGATVAVLLGDGTGNFPQLIRLSVSTATGAYPLGVAVADVNGDGQPDLLAANQGSDALAVLLNTTPVTSTRTLQAAVAYSSGSGSGPAGVAVADVNGDGKLDALTANNSTSTAGVLPGTGSGSFALSASPSSGAGNPYSVAVADVNRDGKPDLLTLNQGANNVGVLLGTGAGSFATVSTYGTGTSSPYALAVADVNGDGKPDLLTITQATATVSVLLGDGSGGFTLQGSQPSTGAGSNPYSLAVADVNGDGKPDVLVANTSPNALAVLLGTGNGGFTLQANSPSIGSGTHPTSLAVADVNRDGKLDVVTANNYTNTVSVLLGDGNGGFTLQASQPSTGAGSGPRSVAVADVNGDGKPDVVTANSSNNTVSLLLGNGNGGFTLQGSQPSTGAGSNPYSLVVADVNRDGKPDVLTANIGTSAVGVLLSAAAPLPVQLVAFTAQASPAAVALAWRTASETNSARFEAERSQDGRTFAPVGSVAAAGTSLAPRAYELLDSRLPAGATLLYYRLRQVDQDGTATYSPVRTVAVLSSPAVLALFPNPTQTAATLTGAAAGAPVQVYDAVGRPVLTATADAAGTAALRLPPGLAQGVYLVRVGATALRLSVTE